MNILIVDDDESLAYFLQGALEDNGYTVLVCHTPTDALTVLGNKTFDLLLFDQRMPEMSGLELFNKVKDDMRITAPTIIMTAFGTTDTTIEAMKRGAFDYIQKPFDITDLLEVIRKLEDQNTADDDPRAAAIEFGEDSEDVLIGQSNVMNAIYKKIGQIASSNANVLIVGESGTGKELIAKAIHRHSTRKDLPFVAVNCAAIPETLFESELFGYEKGAFTGATERRAGKFEKAHTGTLFLDEVGDMSRQSQAKILRVLNDGRFDRVGGSEVINVDVRIIAATNKDLEQEIKDGNFREDLFYRINTFIIRVPPLRERDKDIAELADYFVQYFSLKNDTPVPAIKPDFKKALEKYSWPGNVRQLRQVIQRAVVYTKGTVITKEHFVPDQSEGRLDLEGELEHVFARHMTRFFKEFVFDENRLKNFDIMALAEKAVIKHVLEVVNYRQVRAAEILGISRGTLSSKIKLYALDKEKNGE